MKNFIVMFRAKQFFTYIFLISIFCSVNSTAIKYDEYLTIHQANRCINYFEYFEEKYNIPKHLLRSIATIESGRWHKTAGLYLPWPWTVNQGGKSFYYSSKQEAIEGVKSMLKKGITNIDIGCMQINLHHHPGAFNNLNQAFDPKANIEYATSFLMNHYQTLGSWKKAVAAYHSLGDIGHLYAAKVYKIYSKFLNGTLALNYCTLADSSISSCIGNASVKNASSQNNKSQPANFQKSRIRAGKKDPRRLKSSMILYSSN